MIRIIIEDLSSESPKDLKHLANYLLAIASLSVAPVAVKPLPFPLSNDTGPMFTEAELNEKIPPFPDAGQVVSASPVENPAEIFGGAKSLFDANAAAAASASANAPGVSTAGAPPPPPVSNPAPAVQPPATANVDRVALVLAAERDSKNDAYDARIHQSGKGKKADGTWKLQKGIDKTLAGSVEAENRAIIAAATSGATAGAIIAAAPPAPPAAIAPPPPPPPAAVAVHPADLPIHDDAGVVSFPVFMKKVSALLDAKLIQVPTLNTLAQTVGVAGLPALNADPSKIPAMNNAIRQSLGLHSV